MLSRNLMATLGLLAFCAVSSQAQSPTAVAPEPAPSFSMVPHDSRTETPNLAGIATAATPKGKSFAVIVSKPTQITALPPKGNSTCYSIRSYNFDSIDPTSGVTHFKSLDTCELASNAHLKGASGVLLK